MYVDDRFYQERFGEGREDVDLKSFAVNVFAVRVDWILKGSDGPRSDGLELLHAIWDSE